MENVEYFINHSSSKINPIKPYNIFFYHLIIVLEGSCTYIVDGKEIILKKNDALLLVPGTYRERLPNNEYIHVVIFNFMAENSDYFLTNQVFEDSVNQTIRRLLDIYPYKIYIFQNNLGEKGTENPKIKRVIQNIFDCIMMELYDSSKYQTKNPHIASVLKYINDNITQPISLSNVSSRAHLSKEYTSRLFKQEMGLTVSEYINKQKLSLAREMLANNNLTLQAISRNLGYENYTYFTKIFKECYGINPQKMRNELKKNNE